MKNEIYMKQALSLAIKAKGKTHPNPMVGAVIVKGKRIIAKGYHKEFGFHHAEVNAINDASKKAKGSTLYVTLEPCSHHGKTPPCVDAIIKAQIKKVVVAMKDPNPLNNGKGLLKLKKKGIEVITGVLEDKAIEINKPFIKYINTGVPFIRLKTAQSLDGKIATKTGNSKWITNDKSRSFVQKLRADSDAVLTGINTVIEDDAVLLPRTKVKRYPARIILDTKLRLDVESKMVKSVGLSDIYVFTSKNAPLKRVKTLEKKGVNVICVGIKEGKVSIREVLRKCAKAGLLDILVEAGANVTGSFFDERLVDQMYCFIAPKIIGGAKGISSVAGNGIKKLDKAFMFDNIDIKKFDNDILIIGN